MPDKIVCPICRGSLREPALRDFQSVRVNCLNCGQHQFHYAAIDHPPPKMRDPRVRAAVAHAVFKLQGNALIDDLDLDGFAQSVRLPDPNECIDNLVLRLADGGSAGREIEVFNDEWAARLGCIDQDGVAWVCHEAQDQGLIRNGSRSSTQLLTAKGWQHYGALLRNGAKSRHAFMAMAFNQPELDALLTRHLVPAVAQAGFELRTTQHAGKTAGLIDNRMRVEIRTSRFVVCDLTHHNRGAYWEAGFAEGLGRPVFYTCREDVLKGGSAGGGPHFDTSHQTIVPWHPERMAAAAGELKAMIRATLPDEARMEDPPAATRRP